jgi:cobalt-zinc-cadmium efflux system membrane fusion protein
VQEIDGHNAVFVRVGEGAFELRSVHTGDRAGDFVEIFTGLEPGDEVVTEGSFLLKGQLLRSTLAEEEG